MDRSTKGVAVNKPLVTLCLGLTVLAPMLGGCKSHGRIGSTGGSNTSLNTPPKSNVVAEFHSDQITMDELQKPLVEAYGFRLMLNLVQLHAAELAAQRRGVTVSEADVQAEIDRALLELAKEGSPQQLSDMEIAQEKGDTATADRIRKQILADSETLLDQYLTQKRMTRPEFNISARTGAYLRKMVEPSVEGAITDKMIEDAFNFRYGEKVQVAHIQCQNMQEIGEVKKRLARKEDFGQVAIDLSRNARTGPLRGELPPFSRQQNIFNSQTFVDTAFSLKEGEVSDPVVTGGAYHLIKLIRRIPPKVMKLQDVKESLRRDLHAALLANGMGQMRKDLFDAALASLHVHDPVLAAQFDKWQTEGKARVRGNEEALKKMNEAREAAEKAAATQPATTGPASAPAVVPPMEPATKPAPVPPTAPAGQ
jgi:foldase protein PrsA